jgi:hypothetical protein
MENNLLEEFAETEKIKEVFNPIVHEQTENEDPKRNEDGSIRLKRNWKDLATDRQGRKYNEQIHATQELDNEGFLSVKRRSDTTQLVGSTNRSRAFVDKHHEEGYAYYIMNEEGGRMEQFLANDWEPVTTKEGVVSMPVGQARGGGTTAVLMKKPKEWHEADQNRKLERNRLSTKEKTAPNEADGQYEAEANSPLR